VTVITRYPTSDTAVSGTWVTPTNVQADDGAVASITRGTTKNSEDDRRQGAYGFDSAIPTGATINSVQIEVEHRVAATDNICFLENFASISGVNGAVNSDSLEPTTLTARTYSSYARPGGGSWTRADLLDAVFTTTIRARNGNNNTSNTWEWDYIRVTVDYTANIASGTPASQAATVAGTAERQETASGTPSAQSATTAGDGDVAGEPKGDFGPIHMSPLGLAIRAYAFEAVAGEITGSGTPSAQSAAVAGTAERVIPSSGTPAAQSATTAGAAEREITGSGAPAAQNATTAGQRNGP
jgi:hypothetical protein